MSRNTHDRALDHHGDDLATNVRTTATIASLPAGSTVEAVLEALGAGGGGGGGGAAWQWRGAWSSATAYVTDDVVSDAGSSYLSIEAGTNHLPTDASYWSLVAQKGDTGATGSTGETGAAGPGVPAGGALNQLLAKASGTDYDTHWISASGGGGGGWAWRGAWSSATAYVVDDVVSDNGSAYIAIRAGTGQLPTNATYWSPVAQKGDTGATGSTGAPGAPGPAGPGLPAGGTTGELLRKRSNTTYDTEWVSAIPDTDVTLSGSVGTIPSGTGLHAALTTLEAAIGSAPARATTRWEILVNSAVPDLIWTDGDLIYVEVPG